MGESQKINECKGKLERFSRVTGFFSPTESWNKGKREELKDRKMFDTSIDKKKPANEANV